MQLDEQVRQFIADMDILTDRLTPARRPRDAAMPECSRQELKALASLGQHNTLTMGDLAAILKVQISTATRTIDRLAAKGLVERKRATQDHRIVQVTFSRKGKRIHQFVVESRRTAACAILEALDPGARKIFLQRMTKIAGASS